MASNGPIRVPGDQAICLPRFYLNRTPIAAYIQDCARARSGHAGIGDIASSEAMVPFVEDARQRGEGTMLFKVRDV
jgi:hypothetical protein